MRKYKGMPFGNSLIDKLTEDNAVDMFKSGVRYIYQGLPTRPSKYLLLGLRRPVVPEVISGFRGMRRKDSVPYIMCMVGLMMEVPIKIGKRGTSFVTNERGLEVLRFWAGRNADFNRYMQAYCPYDIEARIKIARVDIALGGGQP
jgi:hypothetical protein